MASVPPLGKAYYLINPNGTATQTSGPGLPPSSSGSTSVALADQPGQDPLSVGPVTFTSRECPADLPIGAGDQLIVETKITGGTKILQTFGPFYKNVRFSGTLWEDADGRYAQLDALRLSGQTTTITWRSYSFTGIVVDLVPGWKNAYRCAYEIELNILGVASNSSSTSAALSVDAVVGQASANVASALASVTSIDPTASSFLSPTIFSNLNASIKNAGPLAQAVGTAAGTSILSNVALASTAVNAYLGTLQSTSPSYVAAKVLANSLTLIGLNVQQGQSPTAVQQLGGSYFEASVLAYGSIDSAFALADANNAPAMRISDSVLQTIVLPPLASAA